MNMLCARRTALALSLAALGTAGCGGSSSSSKPAAGPKTATTPASPTSINASTPINSPLYRALLIKGEQSATQGKFTSAQLGALADCAIKQLQAQGITTVGQALQKQSQFQALGTQCANQLGLHAK